MLFHFPQDDPEENVSACMLVSIFSKLEFKRFFVIVSFKYICKSMELLLIHLLKMEKKSSIISKALLD